MLRIRTIVLLAVVSGLLCACATLKNASKMESFDHVSQSYRRTLMHSDFQSAASYIGGEGAVSGQGGAEKLAHFRVVYCEIKKVSVSADKDTIMQDAELSYYDKNTMIHRTMVDHQKWRYDAEKKRWFLSSGLPALK